ncbi:MAG: GYD domain-containing protein [Deferrisomatales bacterium]|nr:GYD domain-containing protein [Deferrisomatales bacterium]
MATYITLLRFTQTGMEKFKDMPSRLDRAKAACRAAGGELKSFYLTLGQYDAVAVSEFPTEEAFLRAFLTIGSTGETSMETLRSFTEQEYRQAITALP